MSRYGKWSANTRNSGGDPQIEGAEFGNDFSRLHSVNWQDYWALVGESIHNMFIHTKNQSALKALVDNGTQLDGKKDIQDIIETLCPELAETENTVIGKMNAIDLTVTKFISGQNRQWQSVLTKDPTL